MHTGEWREQSSYKFIKRCRSADERAFHSRDIVPMYAHVTRIGEEQRVIAAQFPVTTSHTWQSATRTHVIQLKLSIHHRFVV